MLGKRLPSNINREQKKVTLKNSELNELKELDEYGVRFWGANSRDVQAIVEENYLNAIYFIRQRPSHEKVVPIFECLFNYIRYANGKRGTAEDFYNSKLQVRENVNAFVLEHSPVLIKNAQQLSTNDIQLCVYFIACSKRFHLGQETGLLEIPGVRDAYAGYEFEESIPGKFYHAFSLVAEMGKTIQQTLCPQNENEDEAHIQRKRM